MIAIARVLIVSSEMSLISVIIPCFNAEKWLGEAIASILAQDWGGESEVIVVDDGSTDGSRTVVEGFAARAVCISQPNRGASAARNLGLSHARGDLVQFLDADDVFHRSRFSLMLRAWEESPNANFVGAAFQPLGAGRMSVEEFLATGQTCEPELRNDALSVSYLPAMGLFRKAFLQSLGPWNENLTRWVDLDYHARIAAQGGVFPYLPAKLYGYRQHDGPRISSHNRANTNLDAALRSLSAAEAHFNGGALLPPERKDYFFPFYVHLARGYAQQGDREKFALMLRGAAASGRPGFRGKALAARAFARVFGIRAASRMMERLLPPAA